MDSGVTALHDNSHPMSSFNSTPVGTPFTDIPNTPPPSSQPSSLPLDASIDAREIVRLIQCSQCSYPLREPVTLPCGNTLCKGCIPALHLRTNISYPATTNRLQGFTCPFRSCGIDHAIGDCSADVVLNKVMEAVRTRIEEYRASAQASEALLQVEEKDKWSIAGVSSLREAPVNIQILPGGRLSATYTMAEAGQLAHDSEVIYTPMSSPNENSESLDNSILEQLKEATRSELDCQVCYALFLDPLTTTCGHTLCRKCLHRIQDYSNLCPICRRALALPPSVNAIQAPSNVLLGKMLSSLCPQAVAAREEAARVEDANSIGELDTPLFVCTLSFPHTPTFLHVFEPRYRLMIRRTVESGSRKFGMVLTNPTCEPQGELGSVPFYQYGTMLYIANMHLLDDGRSIIETTGVSRFKVVKYGSLDGYTISKVERFDDMSIAEEEAIEAAETSIPFTRHSGAQDHNGGGPCYDASSTPSDLDLEYLGHLPTQELMEIGMRFVKRMQETSAPWLHHTVVQAYGECPNDPALFPWWFASVIPTSEAEKYKMLATTSVRERLKMCSKFAAELERRYVFVSYTTPVLGHGVSSRDILKDGLNDGSIL